MGEFFWLFPHMLAFRYLQGHRSWARGMVSYGKNPQPTIYGKFLRCFVNHSSLLLTHLTGHRTWTNGPVAISYLVDLLGVPLTRDYAVGHAQGGSKFGATINNTYTNSTAGAPDGFAQVANYTSSGVSKADMASTLHFLWIGNMDISLKHIVSFTNITLSALRMLMFNLPTVVRLERLRLRKPTLRNLHGKSNCAPRPEPSRRRRHHHLRPKPIPPRPLPFHKIHGNL